MKKLPLSGVRVTDLTMMWAGPFATKVLAEMGAEVIKIESPRSWDNIRTLLPQPSNTVDPWNSAFYFAEYNRGKKGVTLDLTSEQGRSLLLRLVVESDVVIENYRADVLDKLGLGYETLRAAKPDIVVVSMAAFGKTGADKDFVGFGPVIEMMSGLASLSGYGDDEEPYKTGISYGDPVAGINAVSAVVFGLLRRRRTGEGVHVDLAQRETSAVLAGEAFVAASLRGATPVHRGNGEPRFVAQGCYRCDGDDQWLVVSLPTESDRKAAGTVLGADLAGLDADQIDAAFAAWCAPLDPQQAMESLQAAGVPAGRVLDTGAIFTDPQLRARGHWVQLPHPRMHDHAQAGIVWRFAEAAPRLSTHAPLFGQHNEEILRGLLGVTEDEYAQLRADGVISDAPVNPGVG